VNLPARLSANLAPRLDEALAIRIIHEDQFAPVTAIHDVINRANLLDSQLAGRDGRVSLAASHINIKNRPLSDPFPASHTRTDPFPYQYQEPTPFPDPFPDSKTVTLVGSGRLPSGAHRPRACRSRFWRCPPIQGESALPICFNCYSGPACSKRNRRRPGGMITSRASSARGPRAGRPTIPVAALLPAPGCPDKS